MEFKLEFSQTYEMAPPYTIVNQEPFDGDAAVEIPFETVKTRCNKDAYVVQNRTYRVIQNSAKETRIYAI